jgi:hypothetical protein
MRRNCSLLVKTAAAAVLFILQEVSTAAAFGGDGCNAQPIAIDYQNNWMVGGASTVSAELYTGSVRKTLMKEFFFDPNRAADSKLLYLYKLPADSQAAGELIRNLSQPLAQPSADVVFLAGYGAIEDNVPSKYFGTPVKVIDSSPTDPSTRKEHVIDLINAAERLIDWASPKSSKIPETVTLYLATGAELPHQRSIGVVLTYDPAHLRPPC